MRPLNLRIAGFTCFSDAVDIDFRGLDVFAVIGPTGAGKTTLIDAMCYALYGRVPRYEGKMSLISHDRDSMSVQFAFEAGGKKYRVHRGINRSPATPSRPSRMILSPVQLEMAETDEDWEPLADRVRSIDDEIERVVGLDFKTFTSCVVLPQGKFQEFLAGEKKDRREVLTDLLDISIYVQMAEAANKRGSDLGREADSLDRRLNEDYKDATPEAVAKHAEELAVDRSRLETARGQRDALNQALLLAQTVVDSRQRQRERESQRGQTHEALDKARLLASDGQTQLVALAGELTSANKELDALVYDIQLHSNLRHALTMAGMLVEATQALAAAAAAAKDERAFASATAALVAATKQLESVEKAHAGAVEGLRVAERQDAASHVRQGLKVGDVCPICGEVIASLSDDAPKVDLTALDKAVEKAERALRAQRTAVTQAESAVATERQRLESRGEAAVRLRSDVARAESGLKELLPAGVVPDVQAIGNGIEALDDTVRAREGLSRRIATVQRAHDELAPRVAASDQEIARLETEARLLAKDVEDAAAAADAAKIELVEHCSRWSWQDVLELIEAQKDPRRVLSERHGSAQHEAESLTARVSYLEREVERLRRAIERAAELRGEMKGLREKSDLYKELGRLLRADAFQSFVIEEAMESLAASASKHLETLYSRFALKVHEGEFYVIDHWQADQERPARTLSGGETFAASLALALALSERIPELRHAGTTQLDSLFLDEGFGTLDQPTLDTVIGALEGLRSQERMVGIITHVPELARRIECRIEVEKSPTGSTLSVVGV